MQYAVIRTDKANRSYIWQELQAGHLRQGWGSRAEQDLGLIKRRHDTGESLSEHERAAWRNKRMLADVWRGLRLGDVVIVPNVPEQGRWVIARVSGPYRFEISDGRSDFGHVLPVEPIRNRDGNIAVVNPSGPEVDARLRGTMRNMSRMWSIDRLGGAVEDLITAITSGGDVSKGQTKAERRDSFIEKVRAEMAKVTWDHLVKAYRGAEFEHLLVPVLESVYGPGNVEPRGGAGEKGADLVVTTQDPLGLTFKTAIQVKMYEGTCDDAHAIAQLRCAREEHGVQAGVVLTTATELSPEFEEGLSKLEDELKIRIQAWTRDDFVRLLLTHLGRREEVVPV